MLATATEVALKQKKIAKRNEKKTNTQLGR